MDSLDGGEGVVHRLASPQPEENFSKFSLEDSLSLRLIMMGPGPQPAAR